MVSLQINYISPLLLGCPQAHEASFSMLLLAKAARGSSSEVCGGWSKVVRTDALRHTRAPHTVQFRHGSTTKLLFLPECYMCGIFLQLNKCCRGIRSIWDVCISHEPVSLLVLELAGRGLCSSCTFPSVSVMEYWNWFVSLCKPDPGEAIGWSELRRETFAITGWYSWIMRCYILLLWPENYKEMLKLNVPDWQVSNNFYKAAVSHFSPSTLPFKEQGKVCSSSFRITATVIHPPHTPGVMQLLSL